MDPVTTGLVLGAGFLAGVAAGMFGIGGGIVMVPALVLGLGFDFFAAKAASLLVIAASTVVGVETHRRAGNVDLRLGAALAASGVAGTLAAIVMAQGLPEPWLRAAFGAVLVLAALRLVANIEPNPERVSRHPLRWAPPIGFVAGLAAGFFGIGGGLVMVPVLVLLGVRIHLAVGTSLVAVTVNAVAGTAGHAYYGYLGAVAVVGVALAAGALAGNWVGAKTAIRWKGRKLQIVFAAFLALVGLYMAGDALA